MLLGESVRIVVVDELGLAIEPIGNDVEPLAAEVDRRAVRQVTAVRKAHPEDRVAGFERGEEDGLVGLGSRMRLDVRPLGGEEPLRAIDCKLLGDVDVLAAAVIALARIAFGVLVGELRSLCCEDSRAGVVLGGDQLDVIFLPAILGGDRRRQLVIFLGQGAGAVKQGGPR